MFNSIFDTNLYPTPTAVIEKMMQGVDLVNKVVLEPSAGTGNIVKWLYHSGVKEVLACEINPACQRILSGTDARMIGDDFLKLTPQDVSHIDIIVMNPPFSEADKHILHAWDIAPSGCEIVALCNSQTLEHSYNSTRQQLADLIQINGMSESFGKCFSGSERQTNVFVSCIRLYKQKSGDEEFSGFMMNDEDENAFYNGRPGLVRYNFIREVVARYIAAVNRFDGAMSAANEINDLTKFIGGSSIKFGAIDSCDKYNNTITREMFKKRLQKESWNFIFDKLNMRKYVTSGVMEKINKFVERQQHIPFTMRNIYHMIDIIVQTQGQRMNQVLVDAFDNICSYSSDNSTAGEKWKTNTNYRVNRKFIVPYICRYDSRWPSGTVDIEYGGLSKLEDIVKALCHLTGTNYDKTTNIREFAHTMRMNWGQWYNWGFFRIKGFKKGTMHFEFADESLWIEFNRKVAEFKGWELPTNTRRARQSA